MGLEKFTPHTFCANARNQRSMLLSEAVFLYLKSLKYAAERTFEVPVKSGNTRKCFWQEISYCCVTLDAKIMPAVRRGAGRAHPCIRCLSTHDSMVRGERSPIHEVTDTMVTGRPAEKRREG